MCRLPNISMEASTQLETCEGELAQMPVVDDNPVVFMLKYVS